MEFSHGQMAENTLEVGTMESNMASVSIIPQKENSNSESGRKERDLSGLAKKNMNKNSKKDLDEVKFNFILTIYINTIS